MVESIVSSDRKCVNCGKPVYGRKGKIFCSGWCRTETHNKKASENKSVKVVSDITKILLKNRRILDSILSGESSIKVKAERLQVSGFNQKYITHCFDNKNGKTYRYCFDVGYLPLDSEWYLVIRQK